MKKTIFVKDLCCERCARRLAEKLELHENVLKAKANYRKNCIFVEVPSAVLDEELKLLVEREGCEVISIEIRKGIFG